jgi:H+-transporting ATPase
MRHTLNRAMSPADFHFIAITTYLTCRVRYFRRRVYGDDPENIVKGLSEAEVQARLGQYGYNEVREQPPDQVRAILKRLLGPIPWMLEIALVLEVALGKTVEPAIIAGWLAFSAVLGGIQERRAQSALDLLRSRLKVNTSVCRDGTWRQIPARGLSPVTLSS